MLEIETHAGDLRKAPQGATQSTVPSLGARASPRVVDAAGEADITQIDPREGGSRRRQVQNTGNNPLLERERLTSINTVQQLKVWQ